MLHIGTHLALELQCSINTLSALRALEFPSDRDKEIVMAISPVSGSASTPTLLDSFHLANGSLTTSSNTVGSPAAGSAQNDFVTLSKRASQRQNISTNPQVLYPANIFISYVDLLRQQRIMQAVMRQALSGTGSTSPEQSSVLASYQTLQYQQSIYESMFNLKGDVFQNRFNITV